MIAAVAIGWIASGALGFYLMVWADGVGGLRIGWRLDVSEVFYLLEFLFMAIVAGLFCGPLLILAAPFIYRSRRKWLAEYRAERAANDREFTDRQRELWQATYGIEGKPE